MRRWPAVCASEEEDGSMTEEAATIAIVKLIVLHDTPNELSHMHACSIATCASPHMSHSSKQPVVPHQAKSRSRRSE